MAVKFLTEVCIALIIFSLLILIQQKRIITHPALITLFFAVFFIDNLIIVLTNRFGGLQMIPNMIWEGFLICCWSGKLYSIVCMLLLLFLIRKVLSRNDVGITCR